jgi:ATP-dependent RNA helicase HelY
MTVGRTVLNLSARDFAEVPRPLGQIELPSPYAPTQNDFQQRVAARLRDVRLIESDWRDPTPESDRRQASHPVEDDPDLRDRLKAANQADRVAREIDTLREQVRGRGNSVARRFDKVLRILQERDYVSGWSLTDKGRTLSRTFHESDLLVSECIHAGLLDGLDGPCLAGLVSVFVYEHRSSEPPPAPWFPNAEVKKRWRRIANISDELRRVEESNSLSVHRSPDPTYIAIAYAWAVGEDFAEVVEAEELSGGDFVRTMKQLIDLLRQVGVMAPTPSTRRTAESAADLLMRGVVAASAAIATGSVDGGAT